MKVAVTGVLAALLVPVAAGPAPAHPPGMYVGAPGVWVHQHTPASGGQPADDPVTGTSSGTSCGFTSSHDETGGVVDPDPFRQSAEFRCGPFSPATPPGAVVTSVTLAVTFQINNAAHGGGGTTRSSITTGAVGFFSSTVDFFAGPEDDVYYCSAVSWTSSTGSGSAVYDANSTAPGDQCALALVADVVGIPNIDEIIGHGCVIGPRVTVLDAVCELIGGTDRSLHGKSGGGRP